MGNAIVIIYMKELIVILNYVLIIAMIMESVRMVLVSAILSLQESYAKLGMELINAVEMVFLLKTSVFVRLDGIQKIVVLRFVLKIAMGNILLFIFIKSW